MWGARTKCLAGLRKRMAVGQWGQGAGSAKGEQAGPCRPWKGLPITWGDTIHERVLSTGLTC